MRIKSLKLLNVKSHLNAEIELSKGINLIIGPNNAGKSAIIKSLMNLQYRSFERRDIRSLQQIAKTVTVVSDITSEDIRLFRNPQNHEVPQHKNEIEIYWSLGISPSGGVQEEYLYATAPYQKWNLNTETAYKHGDIHSLGIGDARMLNNFPRFPDSEDQLNYIFPFLSKRKTEHYDSTLTHEQSFKVEEGMRNLAARVHRIQNPSHPKNQEFVRLCEDILGFSIGVIAIDHQSISGTELGVYVTNTAMIPIKAMGDGVVNIVSFILTLLTEDNKLILIEELENDLHPKALKKLLLLIKEKSQLNQFVISTHSHIVLKYLGDPSDSSIFFVENIRENGNKRIPTSEITNIANDSGSRIDVLDRLGYEFNDFDLYEAYLILEESSAESIIRNFIIPKFIPELIGKIKTIAARGVDDLEIRVIDFDRLFVFIHTNPIYYKKAWIVADGDDAGKQCMNRIRENFKTWPESHFINFKQRNFEEYYPARFAGKAKKALSLDKQEKRIAKQDLIKEVVLWCSENPDEAITEFRSSAEEVIGILRSILNDLKEH